MTPERAASVASQLWEANADLADACLAHPFVRGLHDGTLSAERYARFLAQDAFFLDAFTRAYAVGIARSPDRTSMRAFHALQTGVFDEQRLHEQAAAGRGIDLAAVAPLAATRAYTDFLLATAFSAEIGGVLAAMAPCMHLYGWLGTVIEASNPASTYAAWIATYCDPAYHALVETIDGLLDRFATGSDREAGHYRTAMRLELGFFQAAWHGEQN